MLLLSVLSAATAGAGDVDVGVGLCRTQSPFDGRPMGIRAMGRLGMDDHLALEAGLYARFPGQSVSGLTETLVAIAYDSNPDTTFSQPVDREALAVSALAVASPWRRPRQEGGASWIYGVAGLQARMITMDRAAISPDFGACEGCSAVSLESQPVSSLFFGPEVGLGFDLWLADIVGVRVLATERFTVRDEPDYGNVDANGHPSELEKQLEGTTAVTFDALVAF